MSASSSDKLKVTYVQYVLPDGGLRTLFLGRGTVADVDAGIRAAMAEAAIDDGRNAVVCVVQGNEVLYQSRLSRS